MEGEKKRKRSGEESEDKKPPAAPLLAGLRLDSSALQIALQHVMAFLPTSDYSAVCLSSSYFCNAVESLTKEQLTQIQKDHAVDETFEERIQDQSQLETKRTKPVPLPFRYLQKKTNSVHLYTIGPAMQGESHVSAIAFFPASSKDGIVLVQEDRGADRSLIQIWDVRTKKCLRENSFEKTQDDWGASDKHYAVDIICMGSSIVVCHHRMIQVWNESLALLQEHRFGNDPCHVERWVQHGQKLVHFKDGRIFSLDILNGFHPQEMVVVFEIEEQRPAQVDTQLIGVCGDWLVANCYHESGDTPPNFCAGELGLYVYSLNNEHVEQDHLHGNNYICVQQSHANPAIFYALRVYKSSQASNTTNRTGSSFTFQFDPREGVVDVVELSRHGKLSVICLLLRLLVTVGCLTPLEERTSFRDLVVWLSFQFLFPTNLSSSTTQKMALPSEVSRFRRGIPALMLHCGMKKKSSLSTRHAHEGRPRKWVCHCRLFER